MIPTQRRYVNFSLKLTLKRQYACKHCAKNYTGNVTHLKDHLAKCRMYQKAGKKTVAKENQQAIDPLVEFAKPSQGQIGFPRLSNSAKADLDIQAAMWCFMGNHPFTMFENSFAKAFLHRLNPAYKPPSRNAISGRLLDSIYTQVKSRTEEVIASFHNINVITDESTDINSSRIFNLSIHSIDGSIHYVSEDIQTISMTAFAAAEWLRKHLINVSNHNLNRINSITNDTCSTMFSMWGEVEKYPDLKHVFFIPCDSHGIQLLVKDLLQIPRFNEVIQKAQFLVSSFRKAPLQYARLRKCQ